MLISTSILGIKDTINKDINKVTKSITDLIHIDIMDGKFVPNNSFKFSDFENINFMDKDLDIHLMVDDPILYINMYKKLKPKYITLHYENKDIYEAIDLIKNNNIGVGIAIKPGTNIEEVYNLLNKVDLVLIMSVEPGFGGQKFIENSVNKIYTLKKYIEKNNMNTIISVDGGIDDKTGYQCKMAGCDILVSGSFITNSNNYDEQIKKLKKTLS